MLRTPRELALYSSTDKATQLHRTVLGETIIDLGKKPSYVPRCFLISIANQI